MSAQMMLIRMLLSTAICTVTVAAELPDVQHLRQLCRDSQSLNHETQQNAVNAIKRLPGAVTSFASLLNAKSEEPEVRAGAALALGTLGAAARPYIQDLATVLSGSSALSQAAAGALAELVREGDAAVVPDLVDRLMHRGPDCTFECYWSITALGKIGSSARPALPVLRQLVADEHTPSDMQAEALSSIRKIEKGRARDDR